MALSSPLTTVRASQAPGNFSFWLLRPQKAKTMSASSPTVIVRLGNPGLSCVTLGVPAPRQQRKTSVIRALVSGWHKQVLAKFWLEGRHGPGLCQASRQRLKAESSLREGTEQQALLCHFPDSAVAPLVMC